MHRRDTERYLQTKLEKNEVISMSDLLMLWEKGPHEDLSERRIGSDLSLDNVEQLKVPCSTLPQDSGARWDHGTGKEYLSGLPSVRKILSKYLVYLG